MHSSLYSFEAGFYSSESNHGCKVIDSLTRLDSFKVDSLHYNKTALLDDFGLCRFKNCAFFATPCKSADQSGGLIYMNENSAFIWHRAFIALGARLLFEIQKTLQQT